MPGIQYGIDGRGDCGVTYAHGMDDCKPHLDICIYASTGGKSPNLRKYVKSDMYTVCIWPAGLLYLVIRFGLPTHTGSANRLDSQN
jgi:hypothetical protein